MEKNGIDALIEPIINCDDTTFRKLTQALGVRTREEGSELVRTDPVAARTARAVLRN